MEGNLTPGTEFAGYRIEGVAGRGGMGVVYRATQVALDRLVALKLVVPDLAQDEDFRQRFKRESRIAASIDHPNAVTVHEAGEVEGQLYISMRYVEGTDLGTLIAGEGALDPERAARIVAQVASALDAAHARGLVHRDVKPANVLIERRGEGEHAYLTDFGLTRHSETHSEITATGAWVGTLDYAPPEQIAGRELDARADVYALGCLLYKAISGNAPFGARQDVAKMYAHMNEEAPPLTESRPGAPAGLDGVLRRALAKDPAARYPSAGDLGRVAVAAAGGFDVAPGERSVATGPAAPGGQATQPLTSQPDGGTPAEPPASQPDSVTPAEPRASSPQASAPTRPLAGGPAGGSSAPTRPLSATDAQFREHTPAPSGDAARSRRRRPLLLAGAALAALLAVVVVALTVLRDGEGNALEATSFATTSIAVGDTPSGLAVGEDAVWVAVDEESRVKRIDPDSGEVTDSIEVAAGTDGAVTVGEGSVFVRASEVVTRIDTESMQVVGNPSEVGIDSEGEIAAGEGSVWTVNPSDDTISKIDPQSGEVDEIKVDDAGPTIAVGEGAVWFTTADRAAVAKLDPESGDVEETAALSSEEDVFFDGAVAVGEGGVWVTNPDEGTLSRIDPASGEVDGDPIRLPEEFGAEDVAVGGNAVWVRSANDGSVIRVDPETKKVVGRPISAGSDSSGRVVVGFGSAWVSQSDGDTVTRLEF